MYKCTNCGNSEKFIGRAEEKGKALIYQNITKEKSLEPSGNSYSWIYIVSNNNWEGNISIEKCYYCNSTKIIELK